MRNVSAYSSFLNCEWIRAIYPYIRKSAAPRVCSWLPGERESTLALTHTRKCVRSPEEEAVSRVRQEERWPAIRDSKRFLKPDSERNVSSVGCATMTRANIPIYRPTRSVRRCTKDRDLRHGQRNTQVMFGLTWKARRIKCDGKSGRICIRWQRFPRSDSY